jgi:hypothetical protein
MFIALTHKAKGGIHYGYVVSLMTAKPSEETLQKFDESQP